MTSTGKYITAVNLIVTIKQNFKYKKKIHLTILLKCGNCKVYDMYFSKCTSTKAK